MVMVKPVVVAVVAMVKVVESVVVMVMVKVVSGFRCVLWEVTAPCNVLLLLPLAASVSQHMWIQGKYTVLMVLHTVVTVVLHKLHRVVLVLFTIYVLHILH